LTDACNKDFIALVQLRGTFYTKNNAMNTHFLHDCRKKKQTLKLLFIDFKLITLGEKRSLFFFVRY
jgi:hypothetical protein